MCNRWSLFNNQLPTKYSNKTSRIGWSELKKLKNDNETIGQLENIHGRASGGELPMELRIMKPDRLEDLRLCSDMTTYELKGGLTCYKLGLWLTEVRDIIRR